MIHISFLKDVFEAIAKKDEHDYSVFFNKNLGDQRVFLNLKSS